MIAVRFKLTRREYARILRRAILHQALPWALLAIGAVGTISAAFAHNNAISLLTGGLIWIALVGGYLGFTVEWVALRRSRRAIESTLTLSDDDGVSLEDQTGRLAIPWSRVMETCQASSFLVIRTQGRSFVVPQRAFRFHRRTRALFEVRGRPRADRFLAALLVPQGGSPDPARVTLYNQDYGTGAVRRGI